MAAQAALLLMACCCAVLSAGLSLRMEAGAVPTPKKMADAGNERPIIGILSQELSPKVKKLCDPEDKYNSYIAASYVKFIEDSKARVVPVLRGQSRDYYERMAKSVNGVLFPGGASLLDLPDGYGASGQAMLGEVKKINEAGGHLPVLGICLGMQIIAIEESGGIGKDIRDRCSSELPLPLEFTPDAKDSKMFKDAPQSVLDTLETENVTINHHMFCVTEKKFVERGLSKNWKILSKNKDENGLEFISSFEANGMPIYALQFHPEKNSFGKNNTVYIHSDSAANAARHFADVLVSEARKNNHSFNNKDYETRILINNYQPTYTGDKTQYEHLYFFEHKVENTRSEPTKADYSPVASAYYGLIVSDRVSQTFE